MKIPNKAQVLFLIAESEMERDDFISEFTKIIGKNASVKQGERERATRSAVHNASELKRFSDLDTVPTDADKIIHFISMRVDNKSFSEIGKSLKLNSIQMGVLVESISKLYRVA